MDFKSIQSFKYNLISQEDKNKRTNEKFVATNAFKNNEQDVFFPSVFISSQTSFPDELIEKKKKKVTNNSQYLLPLVIVPLVFLASGAVFSSFLKQSIISKKQTLPAISRLVIINDDNLMSLYFALQTPSIKTFLACAGVMVSSSCSFVIKNCMDACKDIWVKKQESKIQLNLQENLIGIETRSFSGKNKIVQALLAETNSRLLDVEKNIAFKGLKLEKFGFSNNKNNLNIKQEKETSITDKTWFLILAGGMTIALSILLAKLSINNLKNIGSHSMEMKQNVIDELKNFELKKLIEYLKKSNISADVTKTLLENKKLSQDEVNKIMKELEPSFSVFAQAPESQYGVVNKVTFASAVQDITAFLYTYIISPNKVTRDLFLAMSAFTGISYAGMKSVEAVKEAQTKKYNAKIDLDLHDKLVSIELKNFLTKKRSVIEPLIQEFKEYAKKNFADKEKLAKMHNNILEEIKNGPPYIYS